MAGRMPSARSVPGHGTTRPRVWLWHRLAWPVWRAVGGDAHGRARRWSSSRGPLAPRSARCPTPRCASVPGRCAPRCGATASQRCPSPRVSRSCARRPAGCSASVTTIRRSIAGWLLLGGTLVEMATGEGKTFAATLPACAAALAGVPVHVVTVNDYLAARDAESMAPLYAFFGLRCGAIVHGLSRAERRAVYAGDVAYCSNKELAFDYLRDRTALGDRASPLHLAVDGLARGERGDRPRPGNGAARAELRDRRRSRQRLHRRGAHAADPVGDRRRRRPAGPLVEWALARARTLREGPDYTLERNAMRVRLSDALRAALESQALDGDDGARRRASRRHGAPVRREARPSACRVAPVPPSTSITSWSTARCRSSTSRPAA